MNCRHCRAVLSHKFLDLGFAPPSNDYLSLDALSAPEKFFPLRLFVCDHCWLVQTEDYSGSEDLFREDYAYFSSISVSWLRHAHRYVEMISSRLQLGPDSFVVEVASNDGYLLRNFVEKKIPCLGIEPTASTAAAAEKLGVPTRREFFGTKLADELALERKADLILGNNVYAHVPDINDFTLGLKRLLKPEGTITLEFPHLLQLIRHVQFDTVYHEHFSYLSLHAVSAIFESCGLRIYDVEQLTTHGGSLRIFGCHQDALHGTSPTVASLLEEERGEGLLEIATYTGFQPKADKVKNDLLFFLIEQKRVGKKVLGYGAAAKGVTLLNYAGVRPDLLAYICDAAPSKQGKCLPGCHIPIREPSALAADTPDYVLILPWNIADEIMEQNRFLTENGNTRFVVAVPSIRTMGS